MVLDLKHKNEKFEQRKEILEASIKKYKTMLKNFDKETKHKFA